MKTAQDAAVSLADVQHGEIFIPDEQPQSLLLIDVTKAGRVLISDAAMTKARLFAEIEKRVEKNGKDFFFPESDVKYCSSHTKADHSSDNVCGDSARCIFE